MVDREIVDHLTVAEIARGKLTTKLARGAEASGAPAVFPHDLTEFGAFPSWPAGPAEAPPGVWPNHGKPIGECVATMKTTRERSRRRWEPASASSCSRPAIQRPGDPATR